MVLRVAVLLCVMLAAGQAGAQPTPPQAGRVFCEQQVGFHIAPPTAVPQRYRRFIGIWSDGAWDARTCAALIVESVRGDGTASIVYVFGPLSSAARVPGGVLHGTGVIRGGELRFQNSDGTQFAFRPTIVDLAGRMTAPGGQSYQAIFKKSF